MWRIERLRLNDRNGHPVEEFEIQFIEGERADAELFEALSINQGTLRTWVDDFDTLDERETAALFYLVFDLGYPRWTMRLGKRDDVALYARPAGGRALRAGTWPSSSSAVRRTR